MSFLQPILLIGLPLALLPIIIHLINQHRHRTVEWAATMFLLDAKKMTKGIARLRQILILAMRVLAVLAIIFAASRPLASGWLALAGGKADTVIVLLDRSASMEQRNLETGESKRSAALEKIGDLLEKTGKNAEIVLIDSVTLEPTPVLEVESLDELPQTFATDTTADVPALLQVGIDYLATNESGRSDIWLASDLRQSDWESGSGQWETIRSDLAGKETVRLFLLAFPGTESTNYSVSVSQAKRQRGPGGLQLVMDLSIKRQNASDSAEDTLPVEFTVNGTRTVREMNINGPELIVLGHTMPLGSGNDRGWARVDLPADDNPSDNTAFLVFDEAPARKSVVVSDDPTVSDAIAAAASAAVEPQTEYEAIQLEPSETAQIPWEETAQLFWHAPIPASDSTDAALLRQHVESGRTLVLLPPADAAGEAIFGISWTDWLADQSDPLKIGWWRTESGLLANTRSGSPLPIGDLRIFRSRTFTGETQPFLKLESGETVIAKAVSETPGSVYVWGTLPRPDHSTLAADGVAFFVMIHRGLDEGSNSVARARFAETGKGVVPDNASVEVLSALDTGGDYSSPGPRAAALEFRDDADTQRLLALNRPITEDDTRTLDNDALASLLEGVEYRRIDDSVGSGSSLASEVWRAFLIAMTLALLIEAALSIPPKEDDDGLNRVESST